MIKKLHKFHLATINALGDSHTKPGGNKFGKWLQSYARTLLLVIIIRRRKLDIVGLEEFQTPQRKVLWKRMKKKWGMHYHGDNAILYRKDVWEFVRSADFSVPYFYGHFKKMPGAIMRHKASGKLIAFAATHNPASVHGDALKWRKQGWQIEAEWAQKNLLINDGAIVASIVVGDKNSKASVYKPAIEKLGGKVSGVPDVWGIDWITGWGEVEFANHRTSETKRTKKATDHPVTQCVGII